MPVRRVWEVKGSTAGKHRVELVFTGAWWRSNPRYVVQVDGRTLEAAEMVQEVAEFPESGFVASECRFTVGGQDCLVRIRTRPLFHRSYDLLVNGISLASGKPG